MPIEFSAELSSRFSAIVGERYAIADAGGQEPYLREWRDRYHGTTPLVLLPGSVEEVAAILRLADETRTPIVPQGGNTGLVGGQIPHATGNEIVVSVKRLDKVRAVDPEGNTLDEMRTLARDLVSRGCGTFTLSFHSPSLAAGHTSYVRTEGDVDQFLTTIEGFCEFFCSDLNGVPATPLEFRSDLLSVSGSIE